MKWGGKKGPPWSKKGVVRKRGTKEKGKRSENTNGVEDTGNSEEKHCL